MTEAVGQALEQALAYHRAPGMLPAAHGRPLPEGMLTLIRLAGGDDALASRCAASSGEAETEVAAAAVFFVQQVMFANGSDSYRVLGVNPDAPDARIKEHYRWLVRWLHPDRNTDDWDSVYADRVNVAWQTLRLPERRREYDLARLEEVPAAETYPRPRATSVHMPLPEPAMLSPSTVQRLPVLVLGGLGGIAVVVLFLMWLGAEQGGRDPGRVAAIDAADAIEPPAALDAADTGQPVPEVGAVAPAQDAPRLAKAPAPPDQDPAPAPEAAAAAAAEIAPAPAEATPAAEVAVSRPATAEPARPSSAQALPAPVVAEPRVSPPTRVAQQPVETQPMPPPVTPRVSPEPTAVAAVARTAPVAASAAAPSGLLQEAQAHLLLREFAEAYQSGDINALMRLFTADARNNRGGREAIVYDYQSLFSATESRRLDLRPTGWILRDGGGTLLASYRARVRSSGRLRAEVSEGNIRFDLRLVDGRVRISQVRLDDGA